MHFITSMQSKPYVPTFFYILMTYKLESDIPLDILEITYTEHLEILKKQLGLHIHLLQIRKDQAKLICSLADFYDEKDQQKLKAALVEVSHKVFSIFEPQIKTPIVLQWELI